jgi:flotillin
VSTGNDDAAGAHKITGDMTRIAAQVPALFEALSGMDIKQLMANVQGIKNRPPKGDQKPADGGAKPAEGGATKI